MFLPLVLSGLSFISWSASNATTGASISSGSFNAPNYYHLWNERDSAVSVTGEVAFVGGCDGSSWPTDKILAINFVFPLVVCAGLNPNAGDLGIVPALKNSIGAFFYFPLLFQSYVGLICPFIFDQVGVPVVFVGMEGVFSGMPLTDGMLGMSSAGMTLTVTISPDATLESGNMDDALGIELSTPIRFWYTLIAILRCLMAVVFCYALFVTIKSKHANKPEGIISLLVSIFCALGETIGRRSLSTFAWMHLPIPQSNALLPLVVMPTYIQAVWTFSVWIRAVSGLRATKMVTIGFRFASFVLTAALIGLFIYHMITYSLPGADPGVVSSLNTLINNTGIAGGIVGALMFAFCILKLVYISTKVADSSGGKSSLRKALKTILLLSIPFLVGSFLHSYFYGQVNYAQFEQKDMYFLAYVYLMIEFSKVLQLCPTLYWLSSFSSSSSSSTYATNRHKTSTS